MHLSVGENDKRLKNAEILLRHTAFRLNEMLHNSSSEDRPLVAATLAQVNGRRTKRCSKSSASSLPRLTLLSIDLISVCASCIVALLACCSLVIQ